MSSTRRARWRGNLGGYLFALVILVVGASVALLDQDEVTLNPQGTDAVIFGTPHIIGGDDGAFLDLRPHAVLPLSIEDEGLLIHHTLSTHAICFRAGGVNHCANAIPVP